jgi:hypothetical protein
MVEEAYEEGQSKSIARVTMPAFQALDGHLQSLEEGHVARLVYRLFVRCDSSEYRHRTESSSWSICPTPGVVAEMVNPEYDNP